MTFNCFTLRASEAGENSNILIGKTGKRFKRERTYLVITLVTETEYFDPADGTHGATADAKWAELETLLKGGLVRIYNTDTTNFPNWDGHTEWNSSGNTAYMLVESYQPLFVNMDGVGSSGQKVRQMEVELKSQSKI